MAPDDVKCERAGRLGELVAIAATNVQQQQQRRTLKYGACEQANGNCERQKQASKSFKELGEFASAAKPQKPASGDRQDDHQKRFSSCSLDDSASVASNSSDAPAKQAFVERLAKLVPGLGIMLALCASAFLGTAGMLVKLTTSVHGIQVAVFRALIQLAIYSTIISWRRIGWVPARGELLASGCRALLGGASITFSYYALKLIPLGDATTIRFSLPIWTLIMSYFFLRESCSPFKVSAVVISVAGVVLIAKPDECVYLFHLLLNALHCESDRDFLLNARAYEQARADEEEAFLVRQRRELVAGGGVGAVNQSSESALETTTAAESIVPAVAPETLRQFEGCMLALASSICLSLSLIALRLCKRTPAEITIWWLSIMSVAIGSLTLLLLGEWRLPDNLKDVLFILLNGLCGAIGQWFITSALKVEQSGIIALARTCDIEIAFLYSALLLGEDIRVTSIVGSVLVSLGVVIVVVPRWLSQSAEARAEERARESPPATSASSAASLESALARGRPIDDEQPAGANSRPAGRQP